MATGANQATRSLLGTFSHLAMVVTREYRGPARLSPHAAPATKAQSDLQDLQVPTERMVWMASLELTAPMGKTLPKALPWPPCPSAPPAHQPQKGHQDLKAPRDPKENLETLVWTRMVASGDHREMLDHQGLLDPRDRMGQRDHQDQKEKSGSQLECQASQDHQGTQEPRDQQDLLDQLGPTDLQGNQAQMEMPGTRDLQDQTVLQAPKVPMGNRAPQDPATTALHRGPLQATGSSRLAEIDRYSPPTVHFPVPTVVTVLLLPVPHPSSSPV